ncbi:MAG TPA: RNA polymerase-binding protein DksA, partial [bacterium]
MEIKDRYDEFRALLLKEKQQILEEASRTVDGMNKKDVAFADPIDRASMESDRNFQLRVRDRERKLLKKIDEALLMIEKKTYGKCEICSGEIEYERLKARPVTTMCIECKNEQEEEERRRAE